MRALQWTGSRGGGTWQTGAKVSRPSQWNSIRLVICYGLLTSEVGELLKASGTTTSILINPKTFNLQVGDISKQ